MIEHCISALKLNREQLLFKTYITDALKAIAENTTHLLSPNGVVDYGTTLSGRWVDIITPKKEEPEKEDNRTADEFASDMWERIRGS